MTRRLDLALLTLRLGLGGTLLVNGILKLLPWSRTVGFFESIGAPVPAVSATVNLSVEIAAGSLLLLGIMMPIATALVALDVIAILTPVNLAIGGGAEWWMAAALRLAPALALWFAGPGAYTPRRANSAPGAPQRSFPSRR